MTPNVSHDSGLGSVTRAWISSTETCRRSKPTESQYEKKLYVQMEVGYNRQEQFFLHCEST